MSNQAGIQTSIRTFTGTARDYNSDWHALWDLQSVPAGTFNERLLRWINTAIGASYAELNGAMSAYAASQGFISWNAMNAISLFPVPGVAALVWLDAGDLSTMRQERTGSLATTPVAIGDPVGSWRNKGILGGWATAPADARRPILRQYTLGSQGPFYYLEFDGSQVTGQGDYLVLSAPGLRLDIIEVFAGVRIPSWSTGQSGIITLSPVPATPPVSANDWLSNQGMLPLSINSSDYAVVSRGGAGNTMLVSASGIKNDFHVYEFRKPNNSSATLHINGALAGSDTAITDNFTVMGGDILIGARQGNGIGSFGRFDLTEIVITNQVTASIAPIRAFMETQTYGTVPSYPTIANTTQLATARTQLISEVFSTRGGVLPTTTYTTELEGTPPLTGLTNLATCHRLVIPDYPERPRLYTPNAPRNDKILLTCAGHDVPAGANGLQSTAIQGALTRGIRVVTFVLPDGPTELISGDPGEHEAARSPMSDWVGPVSIVINTLLAEFPGAEIYIAGISGGGWMATMCGACDSRIRGTYDFVGTAPDYYYLNRDWEQRLPGITATYLDLYLLAACPSPRRHKHVWHTGDPVAFNTTLYNSRPPWDAQLAAQATSIGGGNYDFVWDVGNNAHALRNPFFNDEVFAEIAP